MDTVKKFEVGKNAIDPYGMRCHLVSFLCGSIQKWPIFVPLVSRGGQNGLLNNGGIRMKGSILRECKALAADECANYFENRCIPADRPCEVCTETGLCWYFREAVLPIDLEL